MTTQHSNTGEIQPKKKKFVPKGKPFEKGDPRINRKGRPRSFDQLRALFQDIAHEEIEATLNGKKVKLTRAEMIGVAMSTDKKLMAQFLEYAYGKPKAEIDVTSNGETITETLPPEKIAERITLLLELAKARKEKQEAEKTNAS